MNLSNLHSFTSLEPHQYLPDSLDTIDFHSIPALNTPKSKLHIFTNPSLGDLENYKNKLLDCSEDKETSFPPELYDRINKFLDKERLDITAATNKNFNKRMPILKQVSLTLKRKSSDMLVASKASTNDEDSAGSIDSTNIAMPRFLMKRTTSLLFDNDQQPCQQNNMNPKSFIVSIVLEQSNNTETELQEQSLGSITF